MNSGYILVLAFFAGGMLFVAIGYGISRLLQTQKPNAQKLSSYECGEEEIPIGKSSFHFRYYLPAVIFLLFEVEIILIAPVLLAQESNPIGWNKSDWNFLLKAEAILFFAILAFGYVYAISQKYLDWERPIPKTPFFEGSIPDFAYEQFNIEQEKKWKSARQKEETV